MLKIITYIYISEQKYLNSITIGRNTHILTRSMLIIITTSYLKIINNTKQIYFLEHFLDEPLPQFMVCVHHGWHSVLWVDLHKVRVQLLFLEDVDLLEVEVDPDSPSNELHGAAVRGQRIVVQVHRRHCTMYTVHLLSNDRISVHNSLSYGSCAGVLVDLLCKLFHCRKILYN